MRTNIGYLQLDVEKSFCQEAFRWEKNTTSYLISGKCEIMFLSFSDIYIAHLLRVQLCFGRVYFFWFAYHGKVKVKQQNSHKCIRSLRRQKAVKGHDFERRKTQDR